ncbi:MAG: hypothetical protein ACFCVE_16080 [Phycisphaerae bacterium]
MIPVLHILAVITAAVGLLAAPLQACPAACEASHARQTVVVVAVPAAEGCCTVVVPDEACDDHAVETSHAPACCCVSQRGVAEELPEPTPHGGTGSFLLARPDVPLLIASPSTGVAHRFAASGTPDDTPTARLRQAALCTWLT